MMLGRALLMGKRRCKCGDFDGTLCLPDCPVEVVGAISLGEDGGAGKRRNK